MKHSPAPLEQFGDEIYAANGTRIAESVTMVDMPLLTNAPRLLAALSELVELEDMRLRLRQLHEMGHGTDYESYHKRLPMAWAAARAALGPTTADTRKPCTCDGASRGPGRACVVKAGGRLGKLWRCADDLGA